GPVPDRPRDPLGAVPGLCGLDARRQIGGRAQPQVGEPKGFLDLCVVGRWNTRIAVLGDGVSGDVLGHVPVDAGTAGLSTLARTGRGLDRKSTRLNSSHVSISY